MNSVLNIAHRGASSLAPENTLLAARKALDIGADMWELDVGVTVDGALIVIHDDTLCRTTNAEALFPQRAPWNIYDFTLAEIRSLDAGSYYLETDPFGQIVAGNVLLQEQGAIPAVTIPTLEEALLFTCAHNWRVNVEIKILPPYLKPVPVIEQVLTLIESLAMGERVLISSFEHSYLQRVKQLWPKILTGALTETPLVDPVKLLSELNADALHPNQHTITLAQIDIVRQAGFAVNVWTVNDPAVMEQLIDAGVNAIFTDFPQRLCQIRENT